MTNPDPNAPWAHEVAAFFCPSDGNAQLGRDILDRQNLPARINYRFSHGDSPARHDDWTNRSAFIDGDRGGEKTLGSIEDGLSNTLFFSEAPVSVWSVGAYTNRNNGAGNFTPNRLIKTGFGGGVSAANIQNNPSICAGMARPNGMLSGTNFPGRKGYSWGLARANNVLFHTVLPPNQPACTRGGGGDIWWDNTGLEFNMTPASYHTGGVNAGLGDGSVRFISDSIDAGTLNERLGGSANEHGNADIGRYTGPSTYGVWGAMGSIAGGESVSL